MIGLRSCLVPAWSCEPEAMLADTEAETEVTTLEALKATELAAAETLRLTMLLAAAVAAETERL